MDNGYIPHDSIVRQVASEAVLLLGARTALLMQLAHPLVAQGVADHSGFEGDRLGRLVRTVKASMTMVFGDRHETDQVISRINRTHERVRGRLQVSCGRWSAGQPYYAGDPELLLWVHATLADTAVRFHDRLVRPLDEAEKDRYLSDLSSLASAMGIDRQLLSWFELQSYIESMMEDGSVRVGEVAQALARPILYPTVGKIPDRLFRPLAAITCAMLPEKISSGYGLKHRWTDRAVFTAVSTSLRSVRPLVPPGIRSIGVRISK